MDEVLGSRQVKPLSGLCRSEDNLQQRILTSLTLIDYYKHTYIQHKYKDM